jgi:hypothetical protein
MAPNSTLISAGRPEGKMGLRWTALGTYIPDVLLTISAFIFGFSVILSALALITVASNINKLRNAIGSSRIGITVLARSHRVAGATNVDGSRLRLL